MRPDKKPGATMEVIWLVLVLLAVDLAAFLFAADTRPGFQHTSRWRDRHRATTG